MKTLTYSGPDGTIVADPSLELLSDVIFQQRKRYWQGGESELSVVEYLSRKQIRILRDEPSLLFFLVEKHGFFFIHFRPRKNRVEQFVPFAGGQSRPWVNCYMGGDTLFVPRACFVSRPFAWEIVQEFLRSRKPSQAVPWVRRDSLEFPFPAAGDTPPSRADLA